MVDVEKHNDAITKVKIISWQNKDCAEPAMWYRLDDKSEGSRFFQHLLDNAEFDGREEIEIKEITMAEWKEAEKVGREA